MYKWLKYKLDYCMPYHKIRYGIYEKLMWIFYGKRYASEAARKITLKYRRALKNKDDRIISLLNLASDIVVIEELKGTNWEIAPQNTSKTTHELKYYG